MKSNTDNSQKKKAKKITISFKNTTKDMKLYSILINFEEISQNIKDILYPILIKD